ncbi:DUF5304 family protein [Streptomyces sp. 6N223]|uniref:DUF5304 family protein n=1 Tax=Streptomyces sp. 6N223 TaxID=3457412 RepID=UPI003FCF51C7
MSDATDPDAWATACQEDLAAEQARRQERYGAPPLDPAQELRRLADAVTEQIGRIGAGFGLGTAPLASQARAALEPVIERNTEVFRHLAAAGQELLAAYRSAVEDHERSWARPADGRPGSELPPPRRTEKPEGDEGADGPEDEPDGPAGPQRIDLD